MHMPLSSQNAAGSGVSQAQGLVVWLYSTSPVASICRSPGRRRCSGASRSVQIWDRSENIWRHLAPSGSFKCHVTAMLIGNGKRTTPGHHPQSRSTGGTTHDANASPSGHNGTSPRTCTCQYRQNACTSRSPHPKMTTRASPSAESPRQRGPDPPSGKAAGSLESRSPEPRKPAGLETCAAHKSHARSHTNSDRLGRVMDEDVILRQDRASNGASLNEGGSAACASVRTDKW